MFLGKLELWVLDLVTVILEYFKAGVPAIQNKDLARWFVQNRYKPNGFGGGMAPRVPLRPFVTPKRLYLM